MLLSLAILMGAATRPCRLPHRTTTWVKIPTRPQMHTHTFDARTPPLFLRRNFSAALRNLWSLHDCQRGNRLWTCGFPLPLSVMRNGFEFRLTKHTIMCFIGKLSVIFSKQTVRFISNANSLDGIPLTVLAYIWAYVQLEHFRKINIGSKY